MQDETAEQFPQKAKRSDSAPRVLDVRTWAEY